MTNNLNEMMDKIETLCDRHQAQVTFTRASGVWIGVARSADGRSVQHQSPLDQVSLVGDTLASLERMVEVSA